MLLLCLAFQLCTSFYRNSFHLYDTILCKWDCPRHKCTLTRKPSHIALLSASNAAGSLQYRRFPGSLWGYVFATPGEVDTRVFPVPFSYFSRFLPRSFPDLVKRRITAGVSRIQHRTLRAVLVDLAFEYSAKFFVPRKFETVSR